eukprot:TRINITY_DN5403_c0_g1_i2.p2 TRINITY_DN5403_c0_g1~~TRINITY_DN5403_c0_g1_i2.p2  ORF type:complete len:236 (-),score=11.96 TRINITY_DN5403_c0_g1_i2:54-761(-)
MCNSSGERRRRPAVSPVALPGNGFYWGVAVNSKGTIALTSPWNGVILLSQNRSCMPGFYGPSCLPCNCSGYACVDGRDADGRCLCTYPFSGRDCSQCQSGFKAVGKDCVTCAKGEYGPDGLVCLSCPAGTFGAREGQSECDPCPAGQYQPLPAATQCLFAPVGGFVSAKRRTTFEACAAGTFSSSVGSTICLHCSSNAYAASPNSSRFVFQEESHPFTSALLTNRYAPAPLAQRC